MTYGELAEEYEQEAKAIAAHMAEIREDMPKRKADADKINTRLIALNSMQIELQCVARAMREKVEGRMPCQHEKEM